jgi:CheY-like chemotaxis protein
LHRLPRLEGVRVLVVDGDADYRESLQTLLGIQLAEVKTAGSMKEALDLMSSFEPEIVLSDFLLPLQSGCRLVRQMRQEGRDTPAIAVTGYVKPEVRRMCFDAGFQEVLWKPVEPRILLNRIASLTLQRAKGRTKL